ncbi:MAG: hypothetical protein ABIO99_11470 [Candidatus Limnocylindria bacterium]
MGAVSRRDEAVERFDALIATRPGTERRGATMPYTSLNGHMFSFLTPDNSLALRLSASDREAFFAAYESRLVEQHGRVMKVRRGPGLALRCDR